MPLLGNIYCLLKTIYKLIAVLFFNMGFQVWQFCAKLVKTTMYVRHQILSKCFFSSGQTTSSILKFLMQNRNSTITPAMQYGVIVVVACLIITMQTSVRPTLF